MTAPRPPFRIAGAPISWGVCEVPGWGYQLGPDKVLAEMREVGLLATELGPDGFLPAEPRRDGHRPRPARPAGRRRIHPAAAARSEPRPGPRGRAHPRGLRRVRRNDSGAVAVSGHDGYDSRPELDDKGWQTLLDNLGRVSGTRPQAGNPRRSAPARRHDDREDRTRCSGCSTAHRSRCAWTPGTCSSAAPTPPSSPGRRPTGSRTCTSRTSTRASHEGAGRPLTYTEAVSRGMYRPLGTGDVDVAAIVDTCERELRRLVHPRAGHRSHRRARAPRARRGRRGERRIPSDGASSLLGAVHSAL